MALDNYPALGWYGCLLALILSAIWLATMLSSGNASSGENEESSREREFWVNALKLTGPAAFLLSVFLVFARPGSGLRGVLAALIFGFLLPSASLWVFSLARRSRFSRLPLLDGEFALALLLFVMGATGRFYGVRAYSLLFALGLGLSLGILWLRILARYVPDFPETTLLLRRVELQGLFNLTLISSLILAWYHFSSRNCGSWMPVYLGLAILAGRVLFRFMRVTERPGGKGPDLSRPLYLVLVLSLVAAVNFLHSLQPGYFYPFALGLLTAFLLVAIIRDSGSSGGLEDRAGGVLGIFLFLGLVWISFRMALGYGLSLAFLGLVSVFPQEESADERKRIKGFLLLGLAGLSLLGWRIFLQETNLVTFGVDLAAGYGFIGLLAGVILPVLAAAGGISDGPSREEGFGRAAALFGWTVLLSAVTLFFTWIFVGSSGMAASLLGLVLSFLLCGFHFISAGREEGPYRSGFSFMWTALPFAACLMVPLSGRLESFTRAHKVWFLVIMLAIILYLYLSGQRKGKS